MSETTKSYLTVTAFGVIGTIVVTILLSVSGALASANSKTDDKANTALIKASALEAQASAFNIFMEDQKKANDRFDRKLDEIIKAVK